MKAQIPNIVTSCNLICGCIATKFALQGSFGLALLFMALGAAFDFCDGLAARILGVSSPIGKELDSLADDITFGLAPSSMAFYELSALGYPPVLSPIQPAIPYVAFVMAAFSALRLAKFNLDTRQATTFIGLPTPANALFWGSLLVGHRHWFENMNHGYIPLILLIFLSSWLLVCELPMFAMKFRRKGLHDDGNALRYGFLAFCALAFVASIVSGFAISCIALIVLAYILTSLILWATKKP